MKDDFDEVLFAKVLAVCTVLFVIAEVVVIVWCLV